MVKIKLKKLGIKLSELAEDLMLSRPTLDTYIKYYDEGIEVPNDKYQIIFSNIFNDNIKTKQDFRDVLFKYSNMLKRDMDIGILEFSPEDSDLINSIMDKINEDILTESFDRDIYLFISTILNNYKNDSLFLMMAKYVLYLNSIIGLTEITEEEKIFISNYYEVLLNFKENNLKYNEGNFVKFANRVKELSKKQEEGNKKIKDEINELIEQKIKLELKKGISIEDINLDDIITQIAYEKSE